MTDLEKKIRAILSFVSNSSGVTKEQVIEYLNENYLDKLLFTSHVTISELLETNVLMERIQLVGDLFRITQDGKLYLAEFENQELKEKIKRLQAFILEVDRQINRDLYTANGLKRSVWSKPFAELLADGMLTE